MSLSKLGAATVVAVLVFHQAAGPSAGATAGPPTAADAKAFVDDADVRLLKLATDAQQADWVKSTYITDDTEAIAARANEVLSSVQTDLAKQATRFDAVSVPDDVRRRLLLLKLFAVVPAPPEAAENAEMTRIRLRWKVPTEGRGAGLARTGRRSASTSTPSRRSSTPAATRSS
jgi:peptidyl-dipeptidase A